MRNLPATLGALAIVLVGCNGNGSAAPIVRHAPFVLIVPYFSVVGDIRGSNSVSVYKVDPATGAVALAPGSPFASGKDPSADALAPGGRFAYVVNKSSNSVSAYKINSTTGALTRVAGSPFPVGDYNSSGPNGIVVDPTGKYAYVTSEVGVTAFSIDTTTGALVRVPGSPFAAARSNFGTAGIAVEPLGRFAYVLNTFDNSISVYSIDKRGALKRTGSPLDAGQNSNDTGAFASATVEPNGRFLYVTGSCCLYVYAIDARTGALAIRAHLRLTNPGEIGPTGFAIDPTSAFAYAVVGSNVYAYKIDTTGTLKAVGDGKFAVHAGTDPYGITIAPTGKYAYVFDRGSRIAAPTIFAYRIDASTGDLTALARSPFAVADNETDPIARWFNAGRCAAFNEMLWTDAHPPPLVRPGSDGVIQDHVTATTRGYFYDPRSRSALHYPNTDSAGTFTLRLTGPPPPGVPRHDLSKLQTASGIKLGTGADTVVRLLGAPKIVNGCGLQRYVYLRNRDGEPTSLEFTIDDGRVIEIFEDFGG
jgi:6-phosphogluconolactonase (cycloisomerase 2 family)